MFSTDPILQSILKTQQDLKKEINENAESIIKQHPNEPVGNLKRIVNQSDPDTSLSGSIAMPQVPDQFKKETKTLGLKIDKFNFLLELEGLKQNPPENASKILQNLLDKHPNATSGATSRVGKIVDAVKVEFSKAEKKESFKFEHK